MKIFKFKKFNEKTGKKIRLNWKLIGKCFLIFSGSIIFFTIGVFAWFWKDLPSPESLDSRFIAESTKIYDRTGNHLLYDIHGEEKRTRISLSQIPDTLKYAAIALEDQDFYSHRGIKIKSIFRAAIRDVSQRRAAEGGSTITQQLIKRSLLTSEKTLIRKIKEVILAIELEQKFDKDEILEMYLNEIPYGSNAYGIEAAAQTFFGKHASELLLEESALLASLPKAPSYYSPYGLRPEELKSRQEHALNRMSELGYITKEQAEEAKNVDVFEKLSSPRKNISAPHFVMYVKEYIEQKYGAEKVEQGGLKIYTTLDFDKQKIAEEAVRNGAEKNLTKYGAENASLVAMDPKTGQILVMVGSKDYFDKTIDGQVNVAIRDRQPGSSFKPYVYLASFIKGYTPETQIWDVDTDFDTGGGQKYNPKNYDGENRGPIKMKDALAMSLNVPAVKTLYLAGLKDSITLAKNMGITTLNDPNRYGLSLVLGGGEVKLLDHVNAFSTLATDGIYHKKSFILKIEDGSGEILEQYKEESGQRVIEEKYTAMINHILSDNSLRSSVFGENNPMRFNNRPVAAKTGTTNQWRDGWIIGYTPSLAVGVWAGNNNNSPMKNGADGSYVAAPIWREFMDKTLGNYDIENFAKYEKEETNKDILDGKIDMKKEIKVCEIPGKKDEYCLANENCPKSKHDKKKFAQAHSILHYIDKDDPRGESPEKPEKDPQYKNWEEAIKKWLKNNKDYESGYAPEKGCELKDFEVYRPSVKIENLFDGQTIESTIFQIEIKASAEFGIRKVTLFINDEEFTSGNSSSLKYTYSVPENKNNSSINVRASVLDEAGQSSSSEITIKTNIANESDV